MQRVNEFVFYELAIKVHKLTEVGNAVKYGAVWWDWWEARAAVDEIYRQRPLNFTSPVAIRLYQALTAVVPVDWNQAVGKLPVQTGEESSQDADIPYYQVFEIREAAKEFETVLRNECQVMDTYFVTKKGTYSTIDLVTNAHYQVPEPTRGNLPKGTKDDFDQAGKCIAFDVPTAAAFHLLRGTEAVIREYYELLVPGDKKAKPHMRSWGVYIRLLNNHKADPTIMSLLTMMKDVYRNPVIHPEEMYTDERVQVLFGLCVGAVVQLECEIQKLVAKGGILPFPATGAIAALGGAS
jgi:hypothetical protein